MKTKKMTLDWHKQTGAALKDMYRITQKLLVDIGANYPLNSPAFKQAEHLYNTLSKLKCALDDCVFNEHHCENTDTLKRIYYGSDEK